MHNNGSSNGHPNGQLPVLTDWSEKETSLAESFQMAMREKWTIIACAAVALAVSATLAFLSPPIYESTATVLIDTKSQQTALSMFDITGLEGVKNIKNEMEILTSRSLRATVAGTLVFQQLIDGSPPQRIDIIQPEPGAEPDLHAHMFSIMTRLENAVRFETVRGSDAIQIIARSPEPKEAALLANAFAQAYRDRNLVSSRTRFRAVREFLEGQLRNRKSMLDDAEEKLQDYMESKGIVLLDEESKKIIEQMSEVEAQRDAAGIQIESLRKSLEAYKAELAALEPNVARSIGEADDPYIRLLQEQLAKLEVQRDVTIARNPSVLEREVNDQTLREITAQIEALRKKLQERTAAYIAGIAPGKNHAGGVNDPAAFVSILKHEIIETQIQLQALQAKKNGLNAVLAQYEKHFEEIPHKHIQFARLQRLRLSSEKLYLLVEEKYHEAAITEQSEFGYIDIIDPAYVPVDPVSPRKRLYMAAGLVLGFAIGFGIVAVKRYVDIRLHVPEDLRNRGYTLLTAVALMDHEIRKLGGKTRIERNGIMVDAHLISFVNPLCSIAESYRRLRTNILYAQYENPLRSILVTSANPSEGKSTTVSNLAITFAQTGKKTILIDTDMRKPNLHNEFGADREPGLTEVLYEGVPLEEALRNTRLENLDLLVCGAIPPNPSETLGSSRMKDLVQNLRERYDVVLFDSPPVLAVTDPAVLATLSDGVVIVASAGNTRVEALERAVEVLKGVGARLLGIVLNNFDLRRAYGGFLKYKEYEYGYGYTYGSNGNGVSSEREVGKP